MKLIKTICNRLKDLVRRGIIRIFPLPFTFRTFVLATSLILTACILLGCGSTRHVTQTIREISVDTVYLSTQQYDSIYIYQDRLIDRSRDTLYIKDKSIEYRYKLLRDTIKVVQKDSIPYEVTITEVKEITRPLTWFDKLCRSCFWFLVGIFFYATIRHLYKLRYTK